MEARRHEEGADDDFRDSPRDTPLHQDGARNRRVLDEVVCDPSEAQDHRHTEDEECPLVPDELPNPVSDVDQGHTANQSHQGGKDGIVQKLQNHGILRWRFAK